MRKVAVVVVAVGVGLLCLWRGAVSAKAHFAAMDADPTQAAHGREVLAGLCSVSPQLEPGTALDHPPRVTGICFDAEGHVLTSTSMMGTVPSVGVQAVTGPLSLARVIGRDYETDTMVVLPTSDIGLKPVPMDPEAEPRLAEPVWVFGRLLDAGPSGGNAFTGIVSAPRTLSEGAYGRYSGAGWLMQLTTPFIPGLQGAPVVSADNEVIGVVNGEFSRHPGITVAKYLPESLAAAREILERNGDIPRPDLGCGLTVQSAEGSGTASVRINGLKAEGAAARAGLQVGDLILSIDGSAVDDDAWSVEEAMGRMRGGTPATVEVDRGGQVVTVTLTPDVRHYGPREFERPYLPRPDNRPASAQP